LVVTLPGKQNSPLDVQQPTAFWGLRCLYLGAFFVCVAASPQTRAVGIALRRF
jgi:hypothetical protein